MQRGITLKMIHDDDYEHHDDHDHDDDDHEHHDDHGHDGDDHLTLIRLEATWPTS